MPTHTTRHILPFIALSAFALLSAGCETVAPTSASTAASSPAKAETSEAAANAFPRESMKQLRVGMAKATVIELVGQPSEVKTSTTATGPAETWIYVNWLPPVYREVAVELEEVAYTDPITGITRTILDPRQQMERITRKEYFELTFDANNQIVDLDYDLQQTREI